MALRYSTRRGSDRSGGARESGRIRAGPFDLGWAEGAALDGAARLDVGTRPEDVLLGPPGGGVAGAVTQMMDMGHYRQVMVTVDGIAPLTVFVDKEHEVRMGNCSVRLRKGLVYRDGSLAAEVRAVAAAEVAEGGRGQRA